MFKDTKEGSTHHDKDACFKCKMCGNHFFTEDRADTHNHLCVDIDVLKKWAKEGADMQDEAQKEKK